MITHRDRNIPANWPGYLIDCRKVCTEISRPGSKTFGQKVHSSHYVFTFCCSSPFSNLILISIWFAWYSL
ncbi:hypothetical protein BDV40DRAFT_272548 [Aspergillus tamarii]|uniref:Uncharacterized protein n=1 Tax=Aspergillus tamarii TaxID=41984 RepID=A0A5N6UM25_ASPTM|nr:hypothetical protein BDV40DRAFT_272548 [Aspergillus tamarii]